MSGYVYIIELEGSGWIKIGKSKDIAKRIKGLQTGWPTDVVCTHAWFLEDYTEFEKTLHDALSSDRGRGEFFRCPVHRAVNLGNKILQQRDIYNDAKLWKAFQGLPLDQKRKIIDSFPDVTKRTL